MTLFTRMPSVGSVWKSLTSVESIPTKYMVHQLCLLTISWHNSFLLTVCEKYIVICTSFDVYLY